ncbi:hypothetical protein PAAG_11055 [Paracoccidioides lutzii Pb01]|uniref:Uncharacterized protein n=1 Tax=Paracoccidioides lutzii (strain ATCC MYA-826 / Pb01) TaxID=502779 RepID=A0A0A2V2U8_PARBA|nr:hypothetical protein PAAG_11055 [Paracoccidioides lutzii Pb01]KGQ02106.1 hypothetical protein PAAG_11055 [Paracoccidioides lutzii Pb01]
MPASPTNVDSGVMSSMTQQRSYAAFFEDFDEDTNDVIPESKTVANVAAKRSSPKSDIRPLVTSTDGASDSGYSSRTAATLGSAELLPNGKKSPILVRLDTAIVNRDLERVRGRVFNDRDKKQAKGKVGEKERERVEERVEEREKEREKEMAKESAKEREKQEDSRESSSSPSTAATMHPSQHRSSSRPAPKRPSSKARKRGMSYGHYAPDTCPGCDLIGYSTVNMGHPPNHHTMDYPHYMHGYDVPAFPHPYHYPPIVTQEAVSSRRNGSNSFHQNRPISFHSGAMGDMSMYMQMPPPQSYEHGPPISASAYTHYMQPYIPGGSVIPVQHSSQMPYDSGPHPIFERPRASSTSRSPEKPPSARRGSMYGTPVVEYPASPSHKSDTLQRRPSAREARARRQSQSFDTAEDFYRTPQPPVPKNKPPPQVIIPPRPPPSLPPDVRRHSASKALRALPSHTTRPVRKNARETPFPPRPQPTQHPKEKNPRLPRLPYNDNSRVSARHASPSKTSRRRCSSVYGLEQQSQAKDILDQRQREAEEYQSSRSSRAMPVSLATLVKSRRSNLADSDSGSLRTPTDRSRGSDAKTKSGLGVSTTTSASASRQEDDGITVMFGGLTIGLSKDSMDGRINVRSGEEGVFELNIEGRSRPKRYLVLNRKC